MAGNRAYGVIHPDPFDLDPEDFTEEPLDHGDGGWEQDAADSADDKGSDATWEQK
jgi:hypothetical protein